MDCWDFENTSLVILGAGFSRAATDGAAPLMKGYFDKLDKSRFPLLHEFVLEVGCRRTCPDISDANVEKVLLALEQARTANAQIVDKWFSRWFENSDTIRTQLGDYTLERLSNLPIDSDNWAVNVLASTGFGTSYVSLNYDNVAERILSKRCGTVHRGSANCPHCRMITLLSQSCSCDFRSNEVGDLWRGTLAKPHGSIAWQRCTDPGCCSAECIVADRGCRPFRKKNCTNCRQPCVPVMVFPTMSKNLDETPQISAMWQSARAAIEQAESILLFGFSMPTSDELFSQLMRYACEKNRCLKRVGAIDLDPDWVLERFRASVDPTCNVEYVPLRVTPNEIPLWYESPIRKLLNV